MLLQMTADGLDTGNHPGLEASLPEFSFHCTADFSPLLAADPGINSPVRDDFHIVISQQQINQYAVIAFRVPHPQSSLRINFSCKRSEMEQVGIIWSIAMPAW